MKGSRKRNLNLLVTIAGFSFLDILILLKMHSDIAAEYRNELLLLSQSKDEMEHQAVISNIATNKETRSGMEHQIPITNKVDKKESKTETKHKAALTNVTTYKASGGVHVPPRKMSSTSNPVYFLHVGKTGGSSVDGLLGGLLRKFSRKKYVGRPRHYDWSYIQKMEKQKINGNSRSRTKEKGQALTHKSNESNPLNQNDSDHVETEEFDVSETADVITFLREPVSRAISQFYYSQGLPFAKKSHGKWTKQTFDDYIANAFETGWHQPISDGEGGVHFLGGTWRQCWVNTDGIESSLKNELRLNDTALCLRAAERLDQTVWFGFIEDLDRSMKLLQITLDLPETPVLPKKNVGRKNVKKPSEQTRKKVQTFLPKDMWLYNYGKRLFEARWNYFVGDGVYVHPELPPLPEFSEYTIFR